MTPSNFTSEGDMSRETGTACPHVWAALLAVGIAILLLTGIRVEVRRQLPGRLEWFATALSPLRMTGNLLQTRAFSDPGVLPVYGSSELDHHAGNRPDAFFRARPTGFSVFPVGHAGTTCLMILQKIAAAGAAARGRQTVIFLSPTWFAKQEVPRHTVTANLPAAQFSAWIFDSPLSRALKVKIARRLLDYPDTIRDQPLLAGAVRSLAAPTWVNRWIFDTLWPLGKCQNQLSRGLEAGALLWEMHAHPERSGRPARAVRSLAKDTLPRREVDWARLAEQAEARDRARNDGTPYSATMSETVGSQRKPEVRRQARGVRDADFGAKLGLSKEWSDLELLTEVLRDLKIRAMFISQPFNGNFYDQSGTTPVGRRAYYEKLAQVIGPSGDALRDYSEHEEDRFFFNDSGHPSAKAWIYYDQALDQFYHGATK